MTISVMCRLTCWRDWRVGTSGSTWHALVTIGPNAPRGHQASISLSLCFGSPALTMQKNGSSPKESLKIHIFPILTEVTSSSYLWMIVHLKVWLAFHCSNRGKLEKKNYAVCQCDIDSLQPIFPLSNWICFQSILKSRDVFPPDRQATVILLYSLEFL